MSSTNLVDLQRIEDKARRAFGEDGLIYLFMGFLLFLVGLSFYDARFAAFGGLAALLIFPVRALRERITYPRVGYVEFKADPGLARGIGLFAIGAVAVLTLIAFVNNGRFQQYLPLAIAILFSLTLYFGASMSGVRFRDWAVIGLMMASGIVMIFGVDHWKTATALQMWITAVLLIIMGAVDLIRFMRKYPITPETIEAG